MESIYKQFFDGLLEAEKHWRNADHLVYVTYPVVNDLKLLLRALEEVHQSVVGAISEILKFEYLYKRIVLSKNPKENLGVFFSKCSGSYSLDVERETLKEILFLGKKHKESGVEFSRQGKMMILGDDLKMQEVSLEKLKVFLKSSRILLDKTNEKFKGIF